MTAKSLLVLSMLFAFAIDSRAELVIDNSPAPVNEEKYPRELIFDNSQEPSNKTRADRILMRGKALVAKAKGAASTPEEPVIRKKVSRELESSGPESGYISNEVEPQIKVEPQISDYERSEAYGPRLDLPIKISPTTTQVLSKEIEDKISKCTSIVKVGHNQKNLSKDLIDNFKRTWCIIATDHYTDVSNIFITNTYAHGPAVHSDGEKIFKIKGPVMAIPIEILRLNSQDEFKDSLLFIMSHELAHYINNDAHFRNASQFGIYAFGAGSVLSGVATVIPGGPSIIKKGLFTTALAAGTISLYCKSYYKWADNELTADRDAVKHLKLISSTYRIDYKSAARSFIEINNFKEKDHVMPKCTDFKNGNKDGNISITKRNPHPSTKERNERVEALLAD